MISYKTERLPVVDKDQQVWEMLLRGKAVPAADGQTRKEVAALRHALIWREAMQPPDDHLSELEKRRMFADFQKRTKPDKGIKKNPILNYSMWGLAAGITAASVGIKILKPEAPVIQAESPSAPLATRSAISKAMPIFSPLQVADPAGYAARLQQELGAMGFSVVVEHEAADVIVTIQAPSGRDATAGQLLAKYQLVPDPDGAAYLRLIPLQTP